MGMLSDRMYLGLTFRSPCDLSIACKILFACVHTRNAGFSEITVILVCV